MVLIAESSVKRAALPTGVKEDTTRAGPSVRLCEAQKEALGVSFLLLRSGNS